MSTQTYSAEGFRRALAIYRGVENPEMQIAAAALRIAAKVATPGFLENALVEENPFDMTELEYADIRCKMFGEAIRAALTKQD